MINTDFEVLAPAGSFQTFKAVIEAGADAVYVGGSSFGARAYADNFTEEELLQAIDYAHLRGKKVYLTVNTLLKNKEINDELYDYLLPFYLKGLDAVLVQDFGALSYIHKAFPDLPIHTSTQMTVTGIEGVRLLQSYGVTRVVMARETSLAEMKKIHEATGMELEAFVHGALCYCYSGQCLFSSLLGGRSGNRGRCAQPCRLAYTVMDENHKELLKDSYILSMKDMCGIRDINELKEAGVYSLKIEGRMKRPEYAAGVVSFYRKYVDSLKPVSDSDYNKLKSLGNRCGFTDKYYFDHNAKDMITYTFVPVNTILVLPFMIRSFNKRKENEITTSQLNMRATIVLIITIVILVSEFFYFRKIQQGIIDIYNQKQNLESQNSSQADQDSQNTENQNTSNTYQNIEENMVNATIDSSTKDNSVNSTERSNTTSNTERGNTANNSERSNSVTATNETSSTNSVSNNDSSLVILVQIHFA